MPNVIPHRRIGPPRCPGGRQLMGQLVLQDIKLMIAGKEPANLQRARPEHVGDLAGVQHSKKLEDMADERRMSPLRSALGSPKSRKAFPQCRE